MSTAMSLEHIRHEIEQQYGYIPVLFEALLDSTTALGSLWQCHTSAYLANPAPDRFKDILLTAIFLRADLPAGAALHLLNLDNQGVAAPDLDGLLTALMQLRADVCHKSLTALSPDAVPDWPVPGTTEETAVLEAAASLGSGCSTCGCRSLLASVLGADSMGCLDALLGYAQMAVFTLKSHPDLDWSPDRPEYTRLESYARRSTLLPGLLFSGSPRGTWSRHGLSAMERDRLDVVLESIPGVVWEAWGAPAQSDHQIDYISPHIVRFMGYTEDEWRNTPNFWINVVHPDDRDRAARTGREYFHRGYGGVNRYRWIAKDGSIRWIESHSVVIKNDQGQPVGMRGISLDATARYVAEEALFVAQNRLQKIVDANVIGFVLGHSSGEILNANDAFLSMLGVSRAMVEQHQVTWDSLTPVQYQEYDRRQQAYGEPYGGIGPYEKELLHVDGHTVPVLVTGIPSGRNDEIIWIVQDLTGQRTAERERIHLADHMRLLMDSAGEGLFGLDENGICTFMNREGARFLGYDPEELIGQPVHSWIHAQRADGRTCDSRECPLMIGLRNGTIAFQPNDVFWRKDGRSIPVEYASHPLIVDGEIRGSVVNFFDITFRVEAEEERNRLLLAEKTAREKAERTSERIRRLHDVIVDIGETLSHKEVSELIVDETMGALNAVDGAILMLDDAGENLHLVGSRGFSEHFMDKFRDLPLSVPLPVTQACLTGEPVLLRSILEDPNIDLEQQRWARERNITSLVSLPLKVAGKTTGCLFLSFQDYDWFQNDEFSFLLTVADQCAQALERARLFAAEKEARNRVECLAEISAILSKASDQETALQSVTERITHFFADFCVMDLIDEHGSLQRVAAYDRNRMLDEKGVSLLAPVSPRSDSEHPCIRAISTGEPVFLQDVTREILRSFALDEAHSNILLSIGLQSSVAAPVFAGDRLLGAISFATIRGGRRFHTDDLALAVEIAHRIGVYLENAALNRTRQETLALLDTVIRSSPVGIAFLDNEMRYVRINEALAELNGLPAEDHLGRRMEDVLPDLYSRLKPLIDQVLLTEKPLLGKEVQSPAPRPDSKTLSGLLSLYPVRIPDGELLGIGCIVMDITDRLRAEQDLREANQQIARILESISDGFVSLDRDWRFVYVNSRASGIFGIPRDELVGANAWEALPPIVDTKIERELRRAMELKVPVRLTEFVPELDCWFDVHAYPAPDGLSVYFDDVTEKTNAIRAVHDAEKRLRSVIEAISQVVWVTDTQGMMQPSSQWTGFTGQTPEETRGNGWMDAIYPADRDKIERAWTRTLQTGGLFQAEYRIRRADGVYRYVSDRGVPVLGEDGQIIEWTGICTDITDRKEAEAAIRRRNRQLGILSRVSQQVNTILDIPVILREVVQAATMLCGTDAGSIGLWTEDSIHFEEYLKNGEWIPLNASLHRDTGVSGWVRNTREPYVSNDAHHDANVVARLRELQGYDRLMCVPITAPDGRVLGCLFVFSGFSDRPFDDQDVIMLQGLAASAAIALDNTRLLEVSRKVEEALKEANEAKDHFLAVLSHELRNPMAIISNANQILQLVPTDDPNIAQACGAIDRAARVQARLLDDLLDTARIAQGKLMLQRVPLNLTALAENSVEEYRKEYPDTSVAIEFCGDEEVWIYADPVRTEQVLGNLITNAIKYTPQGTIRVGVRREEDRAVLEVHDTGIGMDPEVLSHVFERFTQADTSLAHEMGGLGLGLSLVKDIVELHGGTVSAESAGLGQGSTFTIRLAALAAPVADIYRPTDGKTPEPVVTNLDILLVDDNRDAREMLREILHLYGYSVREAVDGPSAIAEIAKEPPDVVLLDIGLPGMDGYEVVKHLRSQSQAQDIRIIALTGYGQASDKLKALSSGFDAHVTKPVDIMMLERAMRG